jgi:hypothetical protein
MWAGWRSGLLVAQPDSVVRWHREDSRLFCRWNARAGKVGRPMITLGIRNLIRRMSRENPLRGTPRIQSKLALLGHVVAEPIIDEYRVHPRKL